MRFPSAFCIRTLRAISVLLMTILFGVSPAAPAAQQCSDPGVTPTDNGSASPIIIDVSGDGFFLTSAQGGISFDISGSGRPVQIAWTAAGARNAFLALDRNHDGVFTSGKELFGNFTPQPSSPHPNGFLALAEFDKPENGGNGDGIIDANDAVFASLRLWIDSNHDGTSQSDEVFTLPSLGVNSIGLKYDAIGKRDEFGNLFRYRAKINVSGSRQGNTSVGSAAYDVFFATGILQSNGLQIARK